MYSQTLVFAGLLLGAPPEPPTGPKLEKGLEVRWTGTFTEASFRPGVRAIRNYDVDTRLFVIDTGEYGADAVLFTRVFLRPERKTPEPPAGVVRLDMVQIGPHGKVQLLPSPADPDNPDPKLRPWPLVQLQGLPTHEAGMFFQFPDKPLRPGLTWRTEEPDRPIVTWKVTSVDSVRGHPALKLVAEQKTAGYYGDRIRQAEWRRQESLTIVPAKGFAARFERIIEKRDPEAEELSFRSVLTLEQQGQMVYPGRLYQERREEAVHAAAFTAMLDRLLAAGGRAGSKSFEALAKRVSTYMSDHGANDTVPYREAVAAVRKRAESAAKGNLPPTPPPETTVTKTDPLTIGQSIPDIVASSVTSTGAAKLNALKGKPVLLAYFQPSTSSARAVLKMADELHARKLGTVLPLAIGDPAEAKKLHVEQKLNVPIYNGLDVYKTHGLEATPVFVVVDADGVVRHVTRGWGGETPVAVTREFERWAK
jgi:peroxiredoxin